MQWDRYLGSSVTVHTSIRAQSQPKEFLMATFFVNVLRRFRYYLFFVQFIIYFL